jgi:hypothetical protein
MKKNRQPESATFICFSKAMIENMQFKLDARRYREHIKKTTDELKIKTGCSSGLLL